MSVGRVRRGNREVPACTQEEGGSWGKPGFPHGTEPKARDVHTVRPATCQTGPCVPTGRVSESACTRWSSPSIASSSSRARQRRVIVGDAPYPKFFAQRKRNP